MGGLALLARTFQVAPGIGVETERKLWQAGIASWADVFRVGPPVGISVKIWGKLHAVIPQVRRALGGPNLSALLALVPKPVRWRMVPEMLGRVAFLDIETTGLSPLHNHVTCASVYNGIDVRTFVWGENFDKFADYIAQFPAIATFNGTCFDVPFLEHSLHLHFPQVHFDLRFLLRRLGLSGGLKAVEHQLDLDRGELDGIDGYAAVLLWQRYDQTGDERYLHTLLAYNVEDVVNLELLLHYAYNGLVDQELLPFDTLPLPDKVPPRPYTPDPSAVQEVLANELLHFH